MKNRLELAKKLLSDNGVITVQCDDREQAYLKVLMDEIFGRENFLNCVAIKMSESSGVKMNHAKNKFPKLKEYILIYVKPKFKGFIEIDKYKETKWDLENNIFIDLHIVIQYGIKISTVCENIIENVKYNVENLTGLTVKKVNVNVHGIKLEGN